MKVWIVGQVRDAEKFLEWEMQGVFSSEEKAVEYVANRWGFFVAPLLMDVPLPDERVDWPGAYYPFEKAEQ